MEYLRRYGGNKNIRARARLGWACVPLALRGQIMGVLWILDEKSICHNDCTPRCKETRLPRSHYCGTLSFMKEPLTSNTEYLRSTHLICRTHQVS